MSHVGEGSRAVAAIGVVLRGKAPVGEVVQERADRVPELQLWSDAPRVGSVAHGQGTGAIQIHELVMQLRGEAGKRQVEGARIAAAENGGGFFGIEEAATVVTVLGRT